MPAQIGSVINCVGGDCLVVTMFVNKSVIKDHVAPAPGVVLGCVLVGKQVSLKGNSSKLCVKKQPVVQKIKNMEVIPICLPVLSTDLVLYKMAVH